MRAQSTFEKILLEKMAKSNASSENSTRFADPFQTEPAHLAYLLGQANRHSFVNPSAQKKYPRPAPKARTPHSLNSAQSLSFNFLKSYAEELCAGFTSQELKSAFRKAALCTHPDHGGSVQLFIELKTHYQALTMFISTLNTKQN